MEKTKGNGIGCAKAEQMVSASSRRRPPPPPPLPMFLWAKKTNPESVTKQEIAMFWRQKRIEEEDHLLAAIKTAARIRARNLSEEDYKCFEESLMDEEKDENNRVSSTNEIRVGIKDWWTKSKYAYLNQPAIKTRDPPKVGRSSTTYVPNCFTYNPTTPLYPTFLGVF
ncbi:uncharacterized protein LOC115711996 [Cannabis sativa]|uniref:uncharacterized protein LOC115711996 n=1 Tax=Cannabis sativa TaxID=3483 RepID=UPI0029C9CB71|nr:uncharacterized protein LOC115711996 [Cannabis sativa]